MLDKKNSGVAEKASLADHQSVAPEGGISIHSLDSLYESGVTFAIYAGIRRCDTPEDVRAAIGPAGEDIDSLSDLVFALEHSGERVELVDHSGVYSVFDPGAGTLDSFAPSYQHMHVARGIKHADDATEEDSNTGYGCSDIRCRLEEWLEPEDESAPPRRG